MRIKSVPRYVPFRNHIEEKKEENNGLRFVEKFDESPESVSSLHQSTDLLDLQILDLSRKSCDPKPDENGNSIVQVTESEDIEFQKAAGPDNHKSNFQLIDQHVCNSSLTPSNDAIDLSVRKSSDSSPLNEELKNSCLYKMITDPKFLQSVETKKTIICSFCKREFLSQEDLQSHSTIKKDEFDNLVCCACNKKFTQKRYLRYHQRCHSDRNKFICNICTKKYTRLDNLTRHINYHINPNKFPCKFCEKTFSRKDLMNKHLKSHENKYRFFCKLCKKYFRGPLSYEKHKKLHL